jgi:hypothetical protein
MDGATIDNENVPVGSAGIPVGTDDKDRASYVVVTVVNIVAELSKLVYEIVDK